MLALAPSIAIFLMGSSTFADVLSFYIEDFLQYPLEQGLFVSLFFDLLILFTVAPLSLYAAYQTYLFLRYMYSLLHSCAPLHKKYCTETVFNPQQFLRLYVAYLCFAFPVNFGRSVAYALFGENFSWNMFAEDAIFWGTLLIIFWVASLICGVTVYRCTRRWVKDGGRSASYRKVRDGLLVFCASYLSLLTLLYFTADSDALAGVLGDLIVPYLGLMSDFMRELLSRGETWFWLVSACVRLVCAMFGLLCVVLFCLISPPRTFARSVASET